jgi:hypothetical protein
MTGALSCEHINRSRNQMVIVWQCGRELTLAHRLDRVTSMCIMDTEVTPALKSKCRIRECPVQRGHSSFVNHGAAR